MLVISSFISVIAKGNQVVGGVGALSYFCF